MLCCDLGSLEPSPLISQQRTLLSHEPAMRYVACTVGGENRRHCTESSEEARGEKSKVRQLQMELKISRKVKCDM